MSTAVVLILDEEHAKMVLAALQEKYHGREYQKMNHQQLLDKRKSEEIEVVITGTLIANESFRHVRSTHYIGGAQIDVAPITDGLIEVVTSDRHDNYSKVVGNAGDILSWAKTLAMYATQVQNEQNTGR